MIRNPAGWACLLMITFGAPHGAAAAHRQAAEVQFENSCAAAVQVEFNHGITLLHSFEYPETTRIFSGIVQQDPDCAMARWGLAMSIWHPLWAPPTAADLAAGARLLAAAQPLSKSAREAAYLDALGTFFSSTDISTHRQRAQAYAVAMNAVYNGYLEDPEAATFYALSLLGSADPRDKSYTNQIEAAGLLNWVRVEQQTHPGVLHYLIHSYDYPALAHLGLDAAMTYADAAPDSAHAQHMPSHIFTRLGLWERSLASNHDSTRSAAEYTERAGLAGHYDEGLHSMDYLMYAMLQTARDEEAAQLLARLGQIEMTDTENFKVAYTYAASPARYALERRAWIEASQLELLRPDFPWADFGWARSIHHFARGIGASRSGRLDVADRELAEIVQLQSQLPPATPLYWKEAVRVHADALLSWMLFARGETEQALTLALAAADREDAVDKHPVTPGEVLPARELYADMLLEADRFEDALSQYQQVLESAPNRLNALLGAASCARELDATALASQLLKSIQTQTSHANGPSRVM